MITEGVPCPDLIIVDTGGQDPVQDSFLNLSVIENLQ